MQLQDQRYHGSGMDALKLVIAHTKQRTLLWLLAWMLWSLHTTLKTTIWAVQARPSLMFFGPN